MDALAQKLSFQPAVCDLFPFSVLLRDKHNIDVDSLVDRYAHGECHIFTVAANHILGGRCVVLRSAQNGAVHSCLDIGFSLYFDAYGINRLPEIRSRYSGYGRLTRSYIGADDLKKLSGAIFDADDEYVLDDAVFAVNEVIKAIRISQQNGLRFKKPR